MVINNQLAARQPKPVVDPKTEACSVSNGVLWLAIVLCTNAQRSKVASLTCLD